MPAPRTVSSVPGLDTARALLDRLEAHSPGERSHAHRVAVYAVATGERLGLSDERLVTLHRAALLHDVGKLEIEPSILGMRGPADPETLAVLREHTELARETLARAGFGEEVAVIVRDHHERRDGSGYPRALQGDELSHEAQCVGLAEWFDIHAFGSSWVTARGEDEASRSAQTLRGKAFSNEVVDAFLAVQPLIQPVPSR